MRTLRVVLITSLAALTFGSLAATLGYARYLRSAAYRDHCAATVGASLGLPCDIGQVVPRSWTAREFDDVTVWLPGRRGKALACKRAVVHYTPEPDNAEAYELDLFGGACEISTRTWLREDYRRVIESGLRPGFDEEGPRRVRFASMELHFRHEDFRAALSDAHGVVVFADPNQGWAAIECSALNGYVADEPAKVDAQFSPRSRGVQLDLVQLSVPTLPLDVLNLHLAGRDGLHSGMFNGSLEYSESGAVSELRVSGTCFDLSLAECTEGLVPKPWQGCCPEIELQELLVVNKQPQRLRFRGVMNGVVLGDICAPWHLDEIGGMMTLRVREAELSPKGIERLRAAGECANVSLERLTERLGMGVMSGNARLTIDNLEIEQNHIVALSAELSIDPQDDTPYWIEGRLVTELISRALNVRVPPLLPERIEYTQLGLRLEIENEILNVYGTHGDRERTILTARMNGQDFPLIVQPKRAFDLREWCNLARARAAAYLQERLQRLPLDHPERMLSRPLYGEPESDELAPDESTPDESGASGRD